MKKGKAAAVILVLALTVACAFLAVNYLGDYLKLGLDLKGGVQIRLQAVGESSEKDIEKVMEIMNTRINSLGVTEPVIQKEGENRVLIELPGVQDPEEAIELIGKTAQLSFRTYDDEGKETVVLDGSHLQSATEAIQRGDTYQSGTGVGNTYVVQLAFDDEGKKTFADVTAELVEKHPDITAASAYANNDFRRHIAIYLDEEIISFPYVTSAITTGDPVITGFSSLEEAHQLAILLESGALPVPVQIVEKRTIGPTLGADSIAKSQVAGIVGLGLVILFMLVVYRVPGVIAGFSLVMYTVLLLGAMALIGATLTMPGILGVILSIGMCINSNIIIYERLKEELAKGRSLRASINAGFDRALWTIIDSNVTTLIAAAVLFWKGTGSIRGFAVTLSIGILISMFTAILYTRFLLKNTVESGLITNPKLYGAKEA
ncbi:MAG: protein translocase subunit SecD [Peptococcaceae bacterium]|nr:protein translocase subunit SecD [Peptococcaceae bacterium]